MKKQDLLDKALRTQVKLGDMNGIADLILQGANVNAKNKHGWTSLHYAARKGDENLCEFLISKGANVNAKGKYGWTPFDAAKYNCHSTVARVLRVAMERQVAAK